MFQTTFVLVSKGRIYLSSFFFLRWHSETIFSRSTYDQHTDNQHTDDHLPPVVMSLPIYIPSP